MQSVCISSEFLLWCFGLFLAHFFPLAWVSRKFNFYQVTMWAAFPAPHLVGRVSSTLFKTCLAWVSLSAALLLLVYLLSSLVHVSFFTKLNMKMVTTLLVAGGGIAELVPIFKAVKMMCSPHKGTLLLPSLPFLNKLQTSFHCWYLG